MELYLKGKFRVHEHPRVITSDFVILPFPEFIFEDGIFHLDDYARHHPWWNIYILKIFHLGDIGKGNKDRVWEIGWL